MMHAATPTNEAPQVRSTYHFLPILQTILKSKGRFGHAQKIARDIPILSKLN